MGLVNTEDIQSKQNDGSGVQKSLRKTISAMFSCAHRACMVVYSTAACNTCQPMTSAERMRKPQLQSTDLWPETQFSKRAASNHFSRNDGPGSVISSKGIE